MFGIDDAAMGAIIGAGINAGGSLLGGMFGSAGQAAQNAQNWQNSMTMFNMQQTAQQHFLDQQQGYNTLMSNTAYQRSMADMRAAGLNPILAAGGNVTNIGSGGGASAPNVGAPQMGNTGAPMGAGIASAAGSAAMGAQIKAVLTQADKDASQTDLNKSQDSLTKANTGLADEATKRTAQETRTSAATEDAQKAQAEAARATAAVNAANIGLIMQQTNSAAARARIDNATATDVERFGVPRNETLPGFLSRVGRSILPSVMAIPSTNSAKSVDMRPGVPGSPVFGPTTKWNTP